MKTALTPVSSGRCQSRRVLSLTGIPLLLAAGLATAVTAAGTVLVWSRWGRLRYVLRPAGILATEALLLVTVGLFANRHEQFYPDWAALLAPGSAAPVTYTVPAGQLDGWLAARPGVRSFPWHRMNVTVPAGYLQHPQWRYSTVVVLGSGPAPGSNDTVVVSVPVTAATTPATLATSMPAELGHDLRVTAHRWALVTTAHDLTLAVRAVSAVHGRFPALCLAGQGKLPKLPKLPPGVASATAKTVTAAVAWAAAETPPPLAPSTPPVKWVPPAKHRPHAHHSPRPKSSFPANLAAPSAPPVKGVKHVSGRAVH
jgi:hypothetical protein